MRIYLGSPISALQHHAVKDMPVLLSYAHYRSRNDWQQWVPSYGRIMLDSGAFSVMNSGVQIDLPAYVEWAQRIPCDAWAGLDSIDGDWKQSLENYKHGGFPTLHDTDPGSELFLDELIGIAREHCGWIGLGLKPPRTGKQTWVRDAIARIRSAAPDLWIHGWALTGYSSCGFDSVDSTYWYRESHRILRDFNQYLITPGEALDIMVRKIQRQHRVVENDDQMPLLKARGKR